MLEKNDSDGLRNSDKDKDIGAAKKNPNESKPREPDTSRLKYLLLALIEHGQRHDYHEHGPPRFGVHACAKKVSTLMERNIFTAATCFHER